MVKIVLKVPANTSPVDIKAFADTLKTFVTTDDLPALVISETLELSILGKERVAELQETVDEIWVYKVKKE